MIIPYENIIIGLLIFARMSAMVFVIPVIGFEGTPNNVKAGLSLLMTFIVFPFARLEYTAISILPLELVMLFGKEVIIGLSIGFVTTLLFYGIQMAGQIIGIQIGFGIISVMDPLSNIQISLIGQLYYLVALLVFLALNGHHFLVRALVYSFEVIPLGAGVFNANLVDLLSSLSGLIFGIALQIAAPVMITLILTDVGLGFIARVAPQMNVFIVGFPLKIMIGLLVITLVISYLPYIFEKMYLRFQEDIITFIRIIGT